MDPVLAMALLWIAYVATHVGPAVSGARGALTRRLGKLGFIIGFSVVAQVGLLVLSVFYATHRFEGPAGLALGTVGWLRTPLTAALLVGLLLIVGACSPAQYVASAMNGLLPAVRPPHGLERISRHPFFCGIALWSGAHALLATRLVGTVFFAGFTLLATLGALHQERKLIAERGPDFERYVRTTSFLPFVAIALGRQRPAWREQPLGFLLIGGAAAWGLRLVHADLMAWNGAAFALAVNAATTWFLVASYLNSRRAAA